MNILLIDDDPMLIKMLKYKFEKEKINCTFLTDAIETKKYLENTVPDIIVTDIMMPYVSGLELLRYVRKDLKLETPIIVLSSLEEDKTVIKAFELGANDYMTKPFSPNELITRINVRLADTKN